ncbi:MAG: hypothetical protein IKS51_07925 [Erysipelotrichaceae bacterium]|nr:hypothetical protein [Erysipelotrichaceae bacterium]
MNDLSAKINYLQTRLYSLEDLERIRSVISMCEGLECVIDDDVLIITCNKSDASENELQELWDECWFELKKQGLDIVK